MFPFYLLTTSANPIPAVLKSLQRLMCNPSTSPKTPAKTPENGLKQAKYYPFQIPLDGRSTCQPLPLPLPQPYYLSNEPPPPIRLNLINLYDNVEAVIHPGPCATPTGWRWSGGCLFFHRYATPTGWKGSLGAMIFYRYATPPGWKSPLGRGVIF